MEVAKLNENIKFLRKNFGYTQETFANAIGIKRSLVGAYEEGRADPRLNNLLRMSELFNVSVDTLISKDVSKLSDEDLYITGDGAKILSITVDSQERENIELIPQKASAGYLNGYADPDYIESLPRFQLPMLPSNATYRAFEISGDSMLPLQPGTIIIGQYLERISDIKNGKTYVLLSKEEGVVYKRVFNYVDENGMLFLVSDNKSYSPYQVDAKNIIEVWESKAFISIDFPDPSSSTPEMNMTELTAIVANLQSEIVKLKEDK
ncbi:MULTISPECIES: helix-turn-helix domain-containing protein [Reichenbachiella]|uniref:DNA-binding transcriptional regulator, XRE-family HTH domain n=1 Tax=Reichenbachiella agariperforans TaxID=156994 RepID=A0A1M6UZ51_REIAG|nr:MULTISPECIES: helix-turn-helix domain-containing protein [Reichenbachiella]RJE72715.1 transcriptional regulator [Reichenbachiella sp. MSK19-1]SHK74460.1 DNA-binding transcriptional regulator, XRE-family HTH domain [Reichenbachiella agariperforans]